MAYEKIERSFPCPCGKGEQLAEWEEHDTWPSPNKYPTYRLVCEDCARRFVLSSLFGFVGGYWLAITDKATLDKYKAEITEIKEKILQIARPKYERQWIDHIKSQPTRTAMHRELANVDANVSAYGSFMTAAKDPAFVEGKARLTFSFAPIRCMARLNLNDTEITALAEILIARQRESDEFSRRIEKVRVPDV